MNTSAIIIAILSILLVIQTIRIYGIKKSITKKIIDRTFDKLNFWEEE